MGKVNIFTGYPICQKIGIHTVEEYGKLPVEKWSTRLSGSKKIGRTGNQKCHQCFGGGQTAESFEILLKYYDKWYGKAVDEKDLTENNKIRVYCEDTDAKKNMDKLMADII